MATTNTNQIGNQRRRLPKLSAPDPVGPSSDETPRTASGEESARQRRRAQQRLNRQRTPSGSEALSPPSKEVSLFFLFF